MGSLLVLGKRQMSAGGGAIRVNADGTLTWAAGPGKLAALTYGTVSSGTAKLLNATATFANGMGITGATYDQYSWTSTITATDLAQSGTLFSGFKHSVVYGSGGAASKGQAHVFTGDMVISGNGDASNEHAAYAGVLRYDIGTGYTQTGAPAGRAWFTDFTVHGAVAVQQSLLSGINMFVNNYYNGSPSSGDAIGIGIVTKAGAGGGADSGHSNATTYPWDVGLVIAGESSSNSNGFTKGIRVGGAAAPWSVTSSRIGTGIEVNDFITAGIAINRHASGTGPALTVASGSGAIIIGATSLLNSSALFEVRPPDSADPIITWGSSTNDKFYSVMLRNGNGVGKIAISGGNGQFITGSVAGDILIFSGTANKSVILGGSTRVVQVTQDNKIGFFAATPVAQQTFVADPSGGATQDAEARTAIAAIIDKLINLGLMAAS